MKTLLLLFSALLFLASCRETSVVTGWDYNNPRSGGFQKVPFYEQETAPGMVLIQAPSCTLTSEQRSDTLAVPSFYLSKYEETNAQYLAYLGFLKKYYATSTWKAALPDTSIWERITIDGDTMDWFAQNYLRSAQFANFPVVGLNHEQIERYATWKTDRMNEYILIREGILADREANDSAEVFNTFDYLNAINEQTLDVQTLNPYDNNKLGQRRVRMEDGILLPPYRLPNSKEWLIASLAMHSGHIPKTDASGTVGKYTKITWFSALENRDKIAPNKAHISTDGLPQQVNAGWSNSYGIQHLESNVPELVKDSMGYQIFGGSNERPYIPMLPDTSIVDSNDRITFHFREDYSPATSPTLYGFRLAMNRVGWISQDDQRATDEANMPHNKAIVRKLKGRYSFTVNIMGHTTITSNLRLKKDGTFCLQEKMNDVLLSYSGTWKVIGTRLVCFDDTSDQVRSFALSRSKNRYEIGLMQR